MTQLTAISTESAPQALGPYSQAIRAGGFVFCAGQLGIDPANAEMVSGGIREETGQALENLRQVLQSTGLDLGDVTKTTVYLASMEDFAVMNDVYAAAFGSHAPARATVEVAKLPKGATVEIDAVAYAPI